MAFPDSVARIACTDLLSALQSCTRAAVENDADAAATAAAALGSQLRVPDSSGLFHAWGLGGGRSSGGGGRGQAAPGDRTTRVQPVPFQRWELPRAVQLCADAVCLGSPPRDLYSALQGDVSGLDQRQRLVYCIGG